MSRDILEKCFARLFEFPFLAETVTLVWHSGEPLVVPLEFYRVATILAQNANERGVQLRQNIQTNTMLLTQDWCDFIKLNRVEVGISIDGPDFVHDRYRVRRSGRGTHTQVMRGINLLRRNDIQFSAICVITRASLGHARKIFDFFHELNCARLGLNFDEIEGNNPGSLRDDCYDDDVRNFLTEFFELWLDNSCPFEVREFDRLLRAIDLGSYKSELSGDEDTPGRIISIDVNGNFSTFSPELMGHQTHHGAFSFGNVLYDSFESMIGNSSLNRIYGEIQAGRHNCQDSCQYFSLCGGGTPSNKFFETGRFDSTETRYCVTSKKIMIDQIVRGLERRIELAGAIS
jgi:uncharacterized protein